LYDAWSGKAIGPIPKAPRAKQGTYIHTHTQPTFLATLTQVPNRERMEVTDQLIELRFYVPHNTK